ncbi:MAG: hypothetical protein GC129_03660 [Proteobacteria bacterium]|nr:hypothetical protein [Pseudomonadota bacterium]
MKTLTSHLLLALTLGLTLTACGDETPPNENEVTRAMGMQAGRASGTTCIPAKKGGFDCTFYDKWTGNTLTRRFVKGDDGWRYVFP